MNLRNPSVLVVMSLFNPSEDLFFSIDSVIAQSYKNLKLLIVIDGFIDKGLFERLKITASKSTKIILQSHSVNKGLTNRLEEAVQAASEKLIARIDAGDVWYPQKLSKQVQKMSKNSSLIVLGTQVAYKINGENMGESHFPLKKREIMQWAEKNRGMMEHSSIIFKKEKLNYRKFFRYAQDFDLYLRAMKLGEIENISETLVETQIKLDGISFKKRILQEKFQQIALENYNTGGNLPKKPPKVSTLSNVFWSISLPFYTRYVFESHKNGRNLRASFFLALACAINFQLLLVYIRKLK